MSEACAFKNCEKPATTWACGRRIERMPDYTGHPEPARYCGEHARYVADEGWPEYTPACPHCGCLFGVN